MITRRHAIGLFAGAVAGAAGCSRSEGAVQFWAAGREGESAGVLMKDFEAERPDIRVDVQTLPWTAAHEKLLTAFAGDTLPDLCLLGNTWIPEFHALRALEPLDRYAAGSRGVALDDYFAGFLNASRIGETLYGLPWYVDTRLLYYRRDLLQRAGFDEPPTNWDQWVRQLAAITAMVGPERYSILLPLNEFEPLLVLALQQPAELLRSNGRFGNFRSDDFRRTLRFYESMFERGFAPRVSNTQISNVWDEFGAGYFSFYISGPWNIAEFQKRLPAERQDDWMTAPMPGPHGPGVSIAGGGSLVIFRSSQRKPQAWALAEYLSRPAVQQRFYELTGDMPPRRTTWRMPVLAQSPYARAFREQLERVRSPPKVPEWERIANEMKLMAERVIRGVATIDEGVTALDRTTDRILEKRRWMLERST